MMGTRRRLRASHLVRRGLASLRPGGPGRGDRDWVAETLAPAEHALWVRMAGADRRHAVAVARRVQAQLGDRAERRVLAAALLHDVGKLDARLGTFGRVVATLTIATAGRDEVVSWRTSRGLHRRLALYALHPDLGADRLALAGSDPMVVAWAREHHRCRQDWTVRAELAEVLASCDDD